MANHDGMKLFGTWSSLIIIVNYYRQVGRMRWIVWNVFVWSNKVLLEPHGGCQMFMQEHYVVIQSMISDKSHTG